jgi:glucose-6-phosphate dehydrogenase assembly protein OpcA
MEIDLMSSTIHLVPPEKIQPELNRIWESLKTKNTTRASLFNLIFFTEKGHRTAYFQKIAQAVVEKFPARVIFIITDTEAKIDQLKTEVSILTSSRGEFDVACDYIQIETAAGANQRVPFLVLPHLLPDLPVYLVWAEDPERNDPLCNEIARFTDRLIFDSEITEQFPQFAKEVLKTHQATGCEVADLNWARTEDWRDLFSRAFYTEDRLTQVQRTKTLKIIYNAQSSASFCHTKIQPIYLQAWLGSRLGWVFKSQREEKNELIFCYQNKDLPIEVSLCSEKDPAQPPGLILSCLFQTMDGASFAFERNRERLNQISCQYSDANMCALPHHYLFTKAESGHSLVKEICHRGTSEHFLDTLRFISK